MFGYPKRTILVIFVTNVVEHAVTMFVCLGDSQNRGNVSGLCPTDQFDQT